MRLHHRFTEARCIDARIKTPGRAARSAMSAVNWTEQAAANDAYRRVVFTTPYAQVSLMCIDDLVPQERHEYATQIVTVVSGRAHVYIDDARLVVLPGETVVIPPGATHTLVRRGAEPLRLYSVYAPPLHARDAYAETRADDSE
jgi:mannose-6-phosphate isomerase-like protein (cupin superfamily)